MEYKTLGMGQYRALLVVLVIAILTCIYMITKTINQKTELKGAQARYTLAEKALGNPKIEKNKDVLTFAAARVVNLTEEEKEEICRNYEMKMEHLLRIIKSLEENVTITLDKSIEKSEAVIPTLFKPATLAPKLWSIGLLGIIEGDRKNIGLAVNRDIGRYFEINAGVSQDLYFAGLLWKF